MDKIQKWEYDTTYIRRGDSLRTKLNKLGEEGWEVCGVDVERSSCGCEYGTYFILKRPKQDNNG